MKYINPDIDELLNVYTYLDPRFKGSYIDEADVTLVEDCSTREGVDEDEDQDSTSVLTAGVYQHLEILQRYHYLSNLVSRNVNFQVEATEIQSSFSTPQTPEQQMKKEIEDYIKLPLLDAELDPRQCRKVHMYFLL